MFILFGHVVYYVVTKLKMNDMPNPPHLRPTASHTTNRDEIKKLKGKSQKSIQGKQTA